MGVFKTPTIQHFKKKQPNLKMRYHYFILTKMTGNKYWQGCGKMESLYIVGGNLNWCIHFGK